MSPTYGTLMYALNTFKFRVVLASMLPNTTPPVLQGFAAFSVVPFAITFIPRSIDRAEGHHQSTGRCCVFPSLLRSDSCGCLDVGEVSSPGVLRVFYVRWAPLTRMVLFLRVPYQLYMVPPNLCLELRDVRGCSYCCCDRNVAELQSRCFGPSRVFSDLFYVYCVQCCRYRRRIVPN